MARVSKKEMSPQQIDDLFCKFNTTLTKLNTENADYFLSELLGSEERIMLAKRLAAIVMTAHGSSQYRVAQTLSISTATAAKIHTRFSAGDYSRLVALLKKDPRNYLEILNILDSALHLGGILPRYTGKDRYRSFKNLSID